MRGIKAFLNNHRCNAICAALSLPQESPRNHYFSHNIVAQCETQYWRALPLLMRILVTEQGPLYGTRATDLGTRVMALGTFCADWQDTKGKQSWDNATGMRRLYCNCRERMEPSA
eukprot:GHVU01037776.1.p1 GENE.GHVU01037776.1~~GHVU01037776.1.p1  ORF type:complete len:115 (+),score=8.70 GHVU01037776.1:1-345(+)